MFVILLDISTLGTHNKGLIQVLRHTMGVGVYGSVHISITKVYGYTLLALWGGGGLGECPFPEKTLCYTCMALCPNMPIKAEHIFVCFQLLVTSNDSRMRIYDLRDLTLTCKYKGSANNSSQIKASFRYGNLMGDVYSRKHFRKNSQKYSYGSNSESTKHRPFDSYMFESSV